jgi:hypothetical protein
VSDPARSARLPVSAARAGLTDLVWLRATRGAQIPGLPPGPICNPSLASIVAVADPAQTEYLYFYSKGDGTHAFAKTFEEHQQNQLKY